METYAFACPPVTQSLSPRPPAYAPVSCPHSNLVSNLITSMSAPAIMGLTSLTDLYWTQDGVPFTNAVECTRATGADFVQPFACSGCIDGFVELGGMCYNAPTVSPTRTRAPTAAPTIAPTAAPTAPSVAPSTLAPTPSSAPTTYHGVVIGGNPSGPSNTDSSSSDDIDGLSVRFRPAHPGMGLHAQPPRSLPRRLALP